VTAAGATPTLVIVRGNSGSGKSTVAAEVRRRYGRGCALIEQDYLRRIVLREHDSGSILAVAPGFIITMVRAITWCWKGSCTPASTGPCCGN